MRHDFKTLSDLYDYASAKYANRTAAEYTDGQQSYTYARYRETCDNLSRILSNFGISASDKVAILSENGPHWGIAFFATTAYGRVAVPSGDGKVERTLDMALERPFPTGRCAVTLGVYGRGGSFCGRNDANLFDVVSFQFCEK